MDSYVKAITLDVNADENYTIIKAKQGDKINRKIAITLKKDGANFTPTGVSQIWFRVQKPDKNIAIVKSTDSGNPISSAGNVYTVTLSEQCLTASGKAWCDLAFLDSSGNTLSSCAFILNIIPMPNGNTARSISEWTDLQQAIDDAERFASIVAFRTSGNYIQYTVDGTTWVNLTTVGAIGGDLQTQINALNGAINAKTDYLDLGAVSASSKEGAIQQAFEAITIYDRPVAIKFSYNGAWSGLAFKLSGGNYGTIYATVHIDGDVYFGYKRETVFNVYRNATQNDINNVKNSKIEYLDLGGISGETYPTYVSRLERAFQLINVYDKPIAFHFQCNGEWSGIAYKYSNGLYGTMYASIWLSTETYTCYVNNGTFSAYKIARVVDVQDAVSPINTVADVTTELALTSPYTIRLQEAKKVGKIVTLKFAINNGGNAFNIQSGFSDRVNPLCQITIYKPAVQLNETVFFSNHVNYTTSGFGAAIIQTNGNVLCDMVTSTVKEIAMAITYITNE